MSLTKNYYHDDITGEHTMTKRPVSISAWPNTASEGTITIYIGDSTFHSTVTLNEEWANDLIAEVQHALKRIPRTVRAADLGIEGAPV